MSNKTKEYTDKKQVSNNNTPRKRKTSNRKKCPSCDSDSIASIVYGYVVEAEPGRMEKELDAGKIVMGGCCVGFEKWECNKCHTRW